MGSGTSLNRNQITRLLNPIVNALGTHPRLLRHLIIMIDHNLVFLGELMDEAIKWLYLELWKAVLAKLEQLPLRAKPQAETTASASLG